MTCPNHVNGKTLAYNAENLVKDVAGTAQYLYDGDNRRVVSVVGGDSMVYVYDASGRLAAEYGSQAPTGGPGTRYLFADHLGSTRLTLEAATRTAIAADYNPFGEQLFTPTRSAAQGYGALPLGNWVSGGGV